MHSESKGVRYQKSIELNKTFEIIKWDEFLGFIKGCGLDVPETNAIQFLLESICIQTTEQKKNTTPYTLAKH